jgi:hypothetical protein
MAWIKRNLFFLIGSLVALGFMGFGGYLLFTQIAAENKITSDIEASYAELNRLNTLNPNPGNDKVDNITAAKEQQESLVAYIGKTQPFFQHIAPIPDTGTNKVTNSDFARELRNIVVQLQRSAHQQGVDLPNNYYFSFEAQRKLMIFDPASLDKLSVQLGEVKAICDILFDARVNSLDNIQREIVSTNDNNPSDYLSQKTVSTPLADLAPYRITFRSFSGELALVVGSLATSPNGLTVKSINVEPATLAMSEGGGTPAPGASPIAPSPVPGQPFFPPRLDPRTGRMIPGVGVAPAAPAPGRGGNTTFLNEKLLRVTLQLEVCRLKPLASK